MQVPVDGLGSGSPSAVFVSGLTHFITLSLKFYALLKRTMETGRH